jgi:hypothetical protein
VPFVFGTVARRDGMKRSGARSLPSAGKIHQSNHPEKADYTMSDIDATRRGPGLRPWILGILLLVALAALGTWLLEERGDDRTLEGVSAEAG